MSLRARLTIFYMAVLGGVLVLFGLAVYGLISVVLLRQVDDTLERSASEIIFVARVDENGNFVLSQRVALDSSVFIQIWSPEAVLIGTSQLVDPGSRLNEPLDPNSIAVTSPLFSDVSIGETPYRVLSVPMYSQGEYLGVLQAATSLTIIEAARSNLIQLLLVLSAMAVLVAGFVGWASARRALYPLSAVTSTALQITHADDLSRRIPDQGVSDDEVGQLISAFNDTIARLEKLFTTQRRFLADIGHELRTPLTVIRGNVDLMRRQGVEDRELLHSIELEVERLSRLVEDLLALAQAESGKLPMDRRQVELDTLLLEVFSQLSVLVAEGAQLRIGDIDQVLVCGDRDRLKQVAVNLISNAIKYTPKGRIEVELSKRDERAYLRVKDNGAGIPSQDLPHIFERFYRGDKARHRTEQGSGFGLGLSIAYWIVRNHGGDIEAESEVGKGTTFTVILPLANEDCPEETRELRLDAPRPERIG